MQTPFHHIFDEESVGEMINPLPLNQILKWAGQEEIPPLDETSPKILFLGIDIQFDFMDNGSLGVPGAKKDVIRLSKFLYRNADKISKIMLSLDTHEPKQIFHPCWWVDEHGNHPTPFTIITPQDLTDGKWRALIDPALSKNYVRHIDKAGKALCIWPYHCIEGTNGCSLEAQFSNLVHFLSIAKNIPISKIRKGKLPLSEMYGIIKPEYSMTDHTNLELLTELATYDKIIIAGEAKSHCVLESVRQICEFYFDKLDVTRKIYVLTDCMSDIPGFEQESRKAYTILANKYKINLLKSTEIEAFL